MFTHLILYKNEPYFKYAISEDQAIEEASLNPEEVVGIVSSEGLVVNRLKTKVVLEVYKPEEVEEFVQVDSDTYESIPKEDKDILSEELQLIINGEENE